MNKNKLGIGNKKVLIIDDEQILRDVLVEVMSINGIESFAVSRGYQGVEIFKKFHNDIGLILLDLLMPDETGIETYKRLCRIDPNVNVVFMSGVGEPESLQSIPNHNKCDFIKKPFSLNEITEKVNHCMSLRDTSPLQGLQQN